MPTFTSKFNFTLPLVNNAVDANVWGQQINGDLTSLDTILFNIDTANIGPSAPLVPTPSAGMFWINNTVGNAWPVQIYDGAAWVVIGTINPVTHSFTSNVGSPTRVRIFTTPGTGTYTPTAGTTRILVELVGGGGGGGCVVSNGTAGNKGAGAGGSGGAYAKVLYIVGTAGISYFIGTGGLGATVVAPGGNGTASTFSTGASMLTSPGGSGGGSVSTGLNGGFLITQGGFNAVLPTGPSSILVAVGGAGSPGITMSNTVATSGSGGSSFFGGGGYGFTNAGVGPAEGNGNVGLSYGSGGGGALMNTSTGTFIGGAGANGVLYITEFGL